VQASCATVQGLLVEGALPSDLRAHVDDCEECRFFASLSQHLGGATTTVQGAPPLDRLMAELAARGEPLLGRYRLGERLGVGGQGCVFRAVDQETEDVVAIKIARLRTSDEKALEVAHARRVRHANVCRVFHAERHGELRVIVMELLDGPTLAQALPELGAADRVRIFRGICDGVRAAHEAGVLHLDLKPQNVMLRGGREPVVTDFGLSARVDAAERPAGGTPAYMAPEQAHNRPVDARTDVWALGLILQDLAPRRFAAIIRRATDLDPARRFASAKDLASAFERRVQRMRRILRGAAAAFLFGLALLVTAFVIPPPRGRRAEFDPALWGEPDLVPSSAWNVARGARVSASHEGFACGRKLEDLTDGVTRYHEWRHGFAFPPAYGVCVSLDNLGQCGPERPTARLCGGGKVLDRHVADATPAERKELGQYDEPVPCGERWIDVDFGRSYRVQAVRAWHRSSEHVPKVARVLVDDGGGWREVFKVTDSRTGGVGWDHVGYGSGPITADFPATPARRVRYEIDSCSMGDKGHGWLNELEVFAQLPWYDAWRHWLSERSR
jgi:hypothetical protein